MKQTLVPSAELTATSLSLQQYIAERSHTKAGKQRINCDHEKQSFVPHTSREKAVCSFTKASQ